MIILIIGPQGSGKTKLARELITEARRANLPEPYLNDGNLTADEPEKKILQLLFLRQVLSIKTIITMQPMPEDSCISIPQWLVKFKSTIVNTGTESYQHIF